MKRGEIRWYKFKSPDKKRPVLILTRDSVLEYLREVTVVPITSIIRDIPSEVLLTREDGLRKDCAINCDHMQTVSKNKIGSLITTLSRDKLTQVSKAIWFALNL
jgi:mRNA interferase MazF